MHIVGGSLKWSTCDMCAGAEAAAKAAEALEGGTAAGEAISTITIGGEVVLSAVVAVGH